LSAENPARKNVEEEANINYLAESSPLDSIRRISAPLHCLPVGPKWTLLTIFESSDMCVMSGILIAVPFTSL
jgi:hypothetical protein